MSVEHRERTDLPTEPLRERAKELRCLYAVSDILEDPGLSLDDSLRRVVETVPEGWQYPGVCRARIVYRDEAYETPGFAQTTWVQRANVFVDDAVVGSIEVAYLENRSVADYLSNDDSLQGVPVGMIYLRGEIGGGISVRTDARTRAHHAR